MAPHQSSQVRPTTSSKPKDQKQNLHYKQNPIVQQEWISQIFAGLNEEDRRVRLKRAIEAEIKPWVFTPYSPPRTS
eukprot:2116071-Rhodomonas_salina.1